MTRRITRRITRRFLRAALAVMVVPIAGVAFSFATTTPAAAATTGQNAGQQLFCQTGGSTSNNASSQNDLPMVRWSNAITAQHTLLSLGLFDLSQVPDVITRDGVVSSLNGISQSEWTLSTDLVELSQRFCVADSVGYQTDSIVGRLWHGIAGGTKGPVLLTALALIVIISGIWGASRGKPKPWARALKFTVVLGVLVVMGQGAAASTNSGGNYRPGLLSPGWVVTNTFGLISNVGNSLSAAFANVNQQPLSVPSAVVGSDPMSCNQYTSQLVADYQASYSGTSLSYAVPESLNGLWMQSTIPTFVDEQFGMDNNFGPLVYCHLLEDTANIPPATQMRIALAASPALARTNPHTIPSALAWTATSNNEVDESIIGWAACQSPNANLVPSEWDLASGKQVYPSEWAVVKNPDNGNNMTVDQNDCQMWWGAPATGSSCGNQCGVPPSAMNGYSNFDPAKSPFYWPDDPSGIQAAANAAGSQQLSDGQGPVGAGLNNFLSNFHGTTSTSAVITAYIYLASSTGVAGVFLILSLAILLAKLALLVSMLLMVFVVLAALLPGGSPDKLLAFVKHLLGLILFVTCGSLLVSAISVLTSLIVAAGSGVVGQYNIMSIIWVGLAPLGAIVLVHHFFKKVLKAPSPFKPSSALAYSAAASGFAGGLGGSALMDRLQDRGKQGLRSVASRGYNKGSATTAPGGAPTARTGGMDPTQSDKAKGPVTQGPGQGQGQGDTASQGQGQGGAATQKPPGRPKTERELSTDDRLEKATLAGELASATHASVRATRRADKEETKAAKALHRESFGQHPRFHATNAALGDSMRTHYYHWRRTGGPQRAGKKIAIGAAAVTLGLPGGLAVAAYAYHRHRARRQAGQPSGLSTFRQVGRQRRQQALDAYRQNYRQRNGGDETGQASSQGATQQGQADSNDDPFATPPAEAPTGPTGSSAGEPTRRMPVDTPHLDPKGATPRPVVRTEQARRIENTPSSEQVGDRHAPNLPPEPTPPELYDGPPPADEE
ncbi:MAG: hypothetical protein ACYCV7_07310 [Acidimicrobiales bacterium]